jgi:hypothetical protein
MNLQLLPEIALLTVPNFRGYFYTKISLPILYFQKAIPKKKSSRVH